MNPIFRTKFVDVIIEPAPKNKIFANIRSGIIWNLTQYLLEEDF